MFIKYESKGLHYVFKWFELFFIDSGLEGIFVEGEMLKRTITGREIKDP